MSKHGYLLIADITGYTRFLTGSELDHAQGILESLFEVILARLKSPLILSNIQGDAFFAFANDANVHSPGQILDSIEALYFGFRDRVGSLDLKFIVHHGDYVINDIAGRHELTGPDVILLHRLLKNEVAERTGVKAYALITRLPQMRSRLTNSRMRRIPMQSSSVSSAQSRQPFSTWARAGKIIANAMRS